MNFISKLLSGATGGSAGLFSLGSYSPDGDTDSSYEGYTLWSMRPGLRTKGAVSPQISSPEVTMFEYAPRSRPAVAAADHLARNALRRTKTLRHPNILAYVDSSAPTENPGEASGPLSSPIVIVTERVVPLEPSLIASLASHPGAIAWGLYHVAKALAFLNADCGVVHGNVGMHSIYVTPGGDWKLWGLELVTDAAAVSSVPKGAPLDTFSPGGKAVPAIPPECETASYAASWCEKSFDKARPWTVDSYAYGKLVETVFSAMHQSMPAQLASAVRRLTVADPRARPSLSQFLQHCGYFTSSKYVNSMLFLDTIAVHNAQEQDEFFRKQLPELLESAAENVALRKVLPLLISATEVSLATFGASSQKKSPEVKNTTLSTACIGSVVLPAVLKMSAKISDKEFTNILAPHLLQWISVKDRNVRTAMLEGASYYIERVPESVLADKYYSNISAGFLDISPALRDLTIRSMLLFVPKLPERTVNIDLMRAFARLQVDKEPSIRTNTTVCLGKLVRYLNESTREKVIVPAFSRALKDTFPPARVAGLIAFNNSREFCKPPVIVRSVLPAVCPMLIDPDSRVRAEASKLVKSLLEDVDKYASTLPETEPVTQAKPPVQPAASQQKSIPKSTTAPSATSQKPAAASRPGKIVAEECEDTQGWDDFDDDFGSKSSISQTTQTKSQHSAADSFSSGWDDFGDTNDDAPLFDSGNEPSGWQADLDMGDSDAFFREMTSPSSAKPAAQTKPAATVTSSTHVTVAAPAASTSKAMHLGVRKTVSAASSSSSATSGGSVAKGIKATSIASTDWSWDDDDNVESKSSKRTGSNDDGWDADF